MSDEPYIEGGGKGSRLSGFIEFGSDRIRERLQIPLFSSSASSFFLFSFHGRLQLRSTPVAFSIRLQHLQLRFHNPTHTHTQKKKGKKHQTEGVEKQRKHKLRILEYLMECGSTMEPSPSVDHLLRWTQWQLLDSILPTGGFAHSYGLEAAIQSHLVSGHEDLKTHVIHVLDNTGSLLLPFVYCAHKSPTIETWSKLDRWLEATLTNEVSRKASTSQGSALLRVAASVFIEIPTLRKLREVSLSSGTISFHHAPIFGLLCGLLGFDSGFSQRAYMFMTMRDILSAATRLNLVGPLGASTLQHQIVPIAEELAKKWMDRPVEEACQTAPLLDTVQGCHRYLFSRLFCS